MEELGILGEWSCPYQPSENGLAERYHRTLKGSMAALMAMAHVTKTFWSYAARYAAAV